jgi:malate dehydrogenase
VEGVAADISHVDSPVQVEWNQGTLPPTPNCPALQKAATGADVIVVVAGVPRKPGMTRDDLFTVNAQVCFDSVLTCAKVAPGAWFAIITNPVNSTVAIAAEVLKKLAVYNKNVLFGVSALDGMRATTFINAARAPMSVPWVPVVGGHSDTTIVPLFSRVPGPLPPADVLAKLTKRVQEAGTEVVKAKAGRGSATLSMAAAGARFVLQLVAAKSGASNPVVHAYVDTDGADKSQFLALPVLLGRTGIIRRLPIDEATLSPAEQAALTGARTLVQQNVAKGVKFARSKL